MLDMLFFHSDVQNIIPKVPPMSAIGIERPVDDTSVVKGDFVSLAREQQIPWEGGRSILVGDPDSGEVILSHREHQMVPIASLTKLMTVLVALERFGPDDVVIIPQEATLVEGAKANLLAYDRLTVSELVKACMIRSGNDAAYALAAHAQGGVPEFVGWMNAKAETLGLAQTHFENSVGLDAVGHYSTAQDLFDLSRYVIDTHPEVLVHAGAQEGLVVGGVQSYSVKSTNSLLGDGLFRVLGLKTGTTDGAGQSFIGLFELPSGRRVLSVMLGSSNRFLETKGILSWLWDRSKED